MGCGYEGEIGFKELQSLGTFTMLHGLTGMYSHQVALPGFGIYTVFFGWIFNDRRVRLYGGCGAREKVIFVDGVGEQEKKSILGYFSSVWHSVLMKLICGTLFLIRCPLCTFFFPHYV